jgi:hypothetical protein
MGGTEEAAITSDVVRDASDVIVLAVNRALASAVYRADVCGCRGCKAQATAAAEWALDLLEHD